MEIFPRALRQPLQGETIVFLSQSRISCRTGNISTSGMLLFPPVRARPGQTMALCFRLPGSRDWLQTAAILAREASEQAEYSWGVQFTQPPAPVLEAIHAYIDPATFNEEDTPIQELYELALKDLSLKKR